MDQDLVLVVDDEAMIRMLIADSLCDAGLNVLEAASADEALTLLDHGEPVTTVITDVKMPGRLDGLDLAQAVASRWSHIELVVMSGHVSSNDPRLPPKATFLGKPFRQETLLKHLVNT